MSRSIKRGFVVALTVVALGSAGVPSLQAQCHACFDICSQGWHWDECGVAIVGWAGFCVQRCEPGICAVAHQQNCSGALLTPAESDRVLAAAASNQVDALAVYLEASDQVRLNVERSAIQVLGCGGGFLASITIPYESVERLRALVAVPRPGVEGPAGVSGPAITASSALW